MSEFLVVGKSHPRVDGIPKVTGQATYSVDVTRPGMLWGKAARSTYPHARILRVDTAAAVRVPGVVTVLTGRDIPPVPFGHVLRDQLPLARDVVRFVGEKVAAIAAETPDAAEEAAGLIEVDYEELPAVFDPKEAVQAGAPVLHPELHSYDGLPPGLPDLPNVHGYARFEKGDVAAGFAAADRIFEHTFRTPMFHQFYLEPHACVVEIDPAGRIHVWATNKGPFRVRKVLSLMLGIPESQIVVHNGPIGGDFGGKGALIDEPVAYYLAKATGRPIKMIMSSTEEFHAANPRHTSVITLKTGVTRDGLIVARQATTYYGAGAYGGLKPLPDVTLPGPQRALGPYCIPHTLSEGFFVYTNSVPCGHMRGPGSMQVTFAAEAQIDIIARELQRNPIEFRLANGMEEGDLSPAGEQYVGVRMKETLQRAVDAYEQAPIPPPPAGSSMLRGVGVGCCERNTGTGRTSQRVEIGADGRVRVVTGATDPGNGTYTMIRQVVAEVFQVMTDQVDVTVLDTDEAPWDQGTGASRVTHTVGRATVEASGRLRRRLTDVAADLLEAPGELVDLTPKGFVIRERPDHSITLADAARELVRREGGPVTDTFFYESDVPPEHTFAAYIAEVDVDPETGRVTLQRLVCAHDIGFVLNPLLASSQVEGGAIQGAGFALSEELRAENGRIVNGSLGEYKAPTIADVPPRLDVVFVLGAPSERTPFGAKAVAEICTMPPPAAIANAVADAIGAPIFELPITAERVLAALRAKAEAG